MSKEEFPLSLKIVEEKKDLDQKAKSKLAFSEIREKLILMTHGVFSSKVKMVEKLH